MSPRRAQACSERGMALVSSMLLLIIITILALSMFRSFGTLEKIAGNIREKDRLAIRLALSFAGSNNFEWIARVSSSSESTESSLSFTQTFPWRISRSDGETPKS